MRSPTIFLFVIISLVFMLTFVPQQAAQAKTCYDQNKQPFPCPKSNYLQTQQAAKQAANSISSTDTPIPPTETSLATLTNTPLPTFTNAPLPTPTNTPPVQQAAPVVQAVCPSPAASPANSPGITPPGSANALTLSPWLLSGGGMLGGILIGLLVPTVLKRSIGRERITDAVSNQGNGESNYIGPDLNSKNAGRAQETIEDRPEKDEVQ